MGRIIIFIIRDINNGEPHECTQPTYYLKKKLNEIFIIDMKLRLHKKISVGCSATAEWNLEYRVIYRRIYQCESGQVVRKHSLLCKSLSDLKKLKIFISFVRDKKFIALRI